MPRRDHHLRTCQLPATTFAIALLALAIAGCSHSGAESADEIRIGHYASLTGSQATFGQSTDNGIRLAVDAVNQSGGLHGKKIRLITYDDRGDAKEAGTAVTRLISRDQVAAVLGEVASGLSLAGAPVCQENGVPMVTPSSTAPEITTVGNRIFRVCFMSGFQAYACAKFAREQLKAQTAAILCDQKLPYSVGLADEFEKQFTAMGGRITTRSSYQEGDQDYSAQLTSIRSSKPEIVFVPGYYTDVANIAVQARKLGLRVPLVGGDGWDSAKLAEIGGEAIDGCYFCTHYCQQDPRPRVQEFLRTYQKQFATAPDAMAALGFDAANILFAAIQKAPSQSGSDIAAALAAAKNFDGVTGRISIDGDRNAVKPAVILEMKHGVPTLAATIDPPASSAH
ncbi:MAG TPA: ABC transporter substrate-binding protein [Planctomycetaceae bacterium]|jgi:branched-chain amino acid transport system substrate-binding protein|nr:ABC transporter substrate-binding protein [Planctomycetaceae bacterium]